MLRKRKFFNCIILIIGLMSFNMIASAQESEQRMYKCEMLSEEFNENTSLKQIEVGIEDFISKNNLDITKGTPEYVELLYKFLFDEIDEIDELTNRYFSDYAAVYISELQERNALSPEFYSEGNSDIVISGTLAEIKRINKGRMEFVTNSTLQQDKETKGTYSVSKAQEYAKAYALKWNYVYGRFNEDCTNFASQIVHHAGMPLVEGQWQWNGNEEAKRTWNVAHHFTEYWTIIRGYNGGDYVTRGEVNSKANPGDFIAYMSSDTYTIWHVAFVQSKTNGEIYISQHTKDRYNEKWNNISIDQPSVYIIVKFS